MRVTSRQLGGILIMRLAGRLAAGAGDVVVRGAVREALSEGTRKILLDMRDVQMIDSSGVGELVSGLTSALRRGGALKLLGPSQRILSTLESARLEQVFEIYDDEQRAIDSFS